MGEKTSFVAQPEFYCWFAAPLLSLSVIDVKQIMNNLNSITQWFQFKGPHLAIIADLLEKLSWL